MIQINQQERATQERVIKFFQEALGYEYLGNWQDRKNSNIEEEYLKKFLQKHNSDEAIIKKAIEKLKKIASNQQKSLYDKNKEIYNLLRYGASNKPSISQKSIHINYIDWQNPQNNHFAIAEEVTIQGKHTKRPDIVIYINGIAIGVLELKRSNVSITEGIRQNLDNQKREFIQDFFATIQLVMAGNDTQGLRYGTILTPERYYLEWKEENPKFNHNKKQEIPRTLPKDRCEKSDNILDCALYRLLRKERVLEIMHDFVVFDAGIKKLPRHNQYFGVKAAQESLRQKEGGIIWHTQGSGKSLTMVWLAKWILENNPNARVLVITDRIELDEQIEKVFKGVGEDIYRTQSAKDLISELNRSEKRLLCSLVHKFGKSQTRSYDEYIQELTNDLPKDFAPKGDIVVFVDECHRSQSGKLHKAMKEILKNAIFIGFTGTPLLKKDKPTTLETFGKYIHTYKFDEAVSDEVVLDLRYEAKDVDIEVTSKEKIDKWFDIKTKGLSDIAKAQLKQRWATLKKLYSSKSRMEKIVEDIIFDFELRPRLKSGRGNAMLVASSVYEACKYYEIFKSKGFDKVAIITSYRPNVGNIKGEETGEEGEAENIKKYEVYKRMIAEYFGILEEEAVKEYWIEKFEKDVKKRFIDEPAQMKLLIVVDKLLTGFDAPSATYLYIDKPMQDHGLFQAICRVNRLDDKDKDDELAKDYGYIVDYRDLFKSVEKAINDYTSGAFANFDKEDVQGLLKNRLVDAKKKLDEVLEQLEAMTEGVKPPKSINEYKDYFQDEHLRVEFYKKISALVRAYTNIANELDEAGYSPKEQQKIKEKVKHFTALRDELKLISGDYLDLKVYDPAMRYLIDSYIDAKESEVLAAFEDTSIIELIGSKGIKSAIENLPKDLQKPQTLAETIENNIAKTIAEQNETNPMYYEKMSQILQELVKKRKEEVIEYKEYLKEIEELAKMVVKQEDSFYPETIDTPLKMAIYDNLDKNEEIALLVDEAINNAKQDGWIGNTIKERKVFNAIWKTLASNNEAFVVKEPEGGYAKEDRIKALANTIFEIVKKQDER